MSDVLIECCAPLAAEVLSDVLLEMARVLTPGGRVGISVPVFRNAA